jgi:hypothetical protein
MTGGLQLEVAHYHILILTILQYNSSLYNFCGSNSVVKYCK